MGNTIIGNYKGYYIKKTHKPKIVFENVEAFETFVDIVFKPKKKGK